MNDRHQEEGEKLLQMTQTLNKIYYEKVFNKLSDLIRNLCVWRNTAGKNRDKQGVDNLNSLESNLKFSCRNYVSGKKVITKKITAICPH